MRVTYGLTTEGDTRWALPTQAFIETRLDFAITMPRRLCLVLAVAAQGLVFPVKAPPRTRTVRRAEDEQPKEEKTNGDRLAPVEETLSAFVVGAVAAAGAGVEILDAGAVSSALLAGALVGFAAENENQYGFGMLARGLVRSRRPAVRRRLHAIDARRLQERRPWVVSFRF